MHFSSSALTRRSLIKGIAAGAVSFSSPGVFAEALSLTPAQTEGPFYPDRLPLDTDNDLLVINDSIHSAVGEVTHLTGRILDSQGNPLRNALVEIWQVDNNGVYIHTKSPSRDKLDGNFQGFGRFLTGKSGEYYFRTIKPVPYAPGQGGRPPHIHMAVEVKGQETFTTQCYVKGHPLNEGDGVLRGLHEQAQRDRLMVEFAALPESPAGELSAVFDVVLGLTPEH
ncbi:MAG: hypothetical protein AMXMBFR84_15350 [Candidatus Hydrogenedentota bacterium]